MWRVFGLFGRFWRALVVRGRSRRGRDRNPDYATARPATDAAAVAAGAGDDAMNHNNRLKVFSGRANVPLAEKIARCLGDPLGKANLDHFPDGEISVRIEEDVRGR